jgi:hypothetical protein
MDEYFEWRTDRSVEDTLNEQTSLNGEPTGQSAAVLAYIEDLAEHQLHKIRELMGPRLPLYDRLRFDRSLGFYEIRRIKSGAQLPHNLSLQVGLDAGVPVRRHSLQRRL